MITKRRRTDGTLAYGVRGPDHRWVGTFDLLKEARKAERDAFGEDQPASLTCGEFARDWLARGCPRTSGRKLKSETVREYTYRLKAFIKEFEDEALSVPRDRAFRWALEHKHDVPFVAALFAHAHDLGLVGANPFASLGLSKGTGRRDKNPPTQQELERLCDACLSYRGKRDEWTPYGPQFRAFLVFQAYTGLRPGETFELRWSDIEGDRICVARRRGKYGTVDTPKSGHARTVLLPPPARTALGTFPRSLDLVFRGIRGQALNRSAAFRYFDNVRKEANLGDLDLYDLRHFAGHHMYVHMGLPARVVAAQLGHNDGGRLVETLYGHGGVGALDELEEAWAHVG